MRITLRGTLSSLILIGLVVTGLLPLRTAARAATLTPVVALASGTAFACALRDGGIVACWGDNREGQLGPGRTRPSDSQPADVTGLAGPAVQIAAGFAHTCALLTSGEVECWGANTYGQLGDGSRRTRAAPAPVRGLGPHSGVVALVASQNTTCVMRRGLGTPPVWCWGEAEGASSDSLVPIPVTGLPALAHLSSTVCAISRAGAAWCWSSAVGGAQPLRPPFSAGGPVFTRAVTQLASTGLATCALTHQRVFCVGENLEGQLGNGAIGGATSTPTPVINLGTSSLVAGGYGVVCAISTRGALSCWGLNANGQLGDGTTLVTGTPHVVLGLTRGVTAVAFGAASTCALVATRVWCWGDNSNGQLGDGSTLASLAPRLVALSS